MSIAWLKQNWLAISSWIVVIIGALYFLFGFYSKAQLQYPYDDNRVVVYYPLIFHNATAWLFALAALVLFIAYVVGAMKESYSGQPCALLVLICILMVGSLLVFLANPMLAPLSGILFLAAIVLLLVITTYRSMKYGIAAGIVLLSACGLSLTVLMNAFISIRHVETAYLRDQAYQLAVITDSDMDCVDSYFVVFACDDIGLTCSSRWASEDYSECWGIPNKPFPQQIEFRADEANNRLLVTLDGVVSEIPVEG